MLYRPTISTQTFMTKNDFYIDIVTKNNEYTYEAWIYHKDYGIKDLMFGMPTKQQSYEEFLEIVSKNIDEYIEYYVDEHFDFEERGKFYENYNFQS